MSTAPGKPYTGKVLDYIAENSATSLHGRHQIWLGPLNPVTKAPCVPLADGRFLSVRRYLLADQRQPGHVLSIRRLCSNTRCIAAPCHRVENVLRPG